MRIASLIAGTVAGCLLAVAAVAQDGIELPPGPDRDLVYGKCRTCHDLQYLVESAGVPRNAWSDLLDSMKKYGLELSSADRGKILNYLATYLGPNPPPKATAAAPPAKVDGAQVFNEQCIACHQANGQGVAGQFPPLAGNRDLFLATRLVPTVVLFGMQGPIEVNGRHFNGAMPPFDFLPDEQIAAVAGYVRGAWGNDALQPQTAKPIVPATVAALRKTKMTPQAVYKRRQTLKQARK